MDLKQEASKLVNGGQREKDYGHPKTNHERIAKIWSAVFDHEVTPTQVVLCMLGMKLARLVHTPDHSDTHLDIYGYVEVLKRVLDPEDLPGTSTIKVSYNKAVPEIPVTPTDGRVYVDGELWGYMKNGVFRSKPKTALWEPSPIEELLAKKAELYESGSREYGSVGLPHAFCEDGCTDEPAAFTAPYPDGSVEGTLDEALAKRPPVSCHRDDLKGRCPRCGQEDMTFEEAVGAPHVDYFTAPKGDPRRNPCGQ